MTSSANDKILAALDHAPLNGFYRRLVVIAGMGSLFDAMDVIIVGAVMASLGREWHLAPQQRGFIITLNLLGMFIGAAASGYLADRYGRKTIFGITLLLYSLLSGVSAFAWNVASMGLIRFFAGMGLGGEIPVGVTLVSEFAPARLRGRMIVILESFWGWGSIAAALIGFLVIPHYGWRAAFLIGALPALYIFVLRRGIPESPRYLLAKGDVKGAQASLREVQSDATLTLESAAAPPEKVRIAELFAPHMVRRTLTLWILWVTMVFSYYGIFTWLPSLLTEKGFSLQFAFLLNLLIATFQIPGYFTAAWLVERIGRKRTLGLFLGLCAVGAFFFAQQSLGATPNVAAILVWGAVISFFNLGAWGVCYCYTPEQYPTRLRATGSGFASAAGRFVGAFGPYVVGLMLAAFGGSQYAVFIAFTVILLLGGCVVLAFGDETAGKTLEEISQTRSAGEVSSIAAITATSEA